MTRFYFSVVTAAGKIIDQEGTELSDLAAARVEAIKDARSLMSEAILAGNDISGRSIEIGDDSGKILLVVSFADAISRSD
jgi:hypothetical protein